MITHENPYGKEGNYNGPMKNYKDRAKGRRGGGEGEERRARKNFRKATRQKSQQEEHSGEREVVNIH
jgi:hypothetical protein